MRRIELAAQRDGDAANPALEQRYRELWTRTNAALGEIDSLIGALER